MYFLVYIIRFTLLIHAKVIHNHKRLIVPLEILLCVATRAERRGDQGRHGPGILGYFAR